MLESLIYAAVLHSLGPNRPSLLAALDEAESPHADGQAAGPCLTVVR